MLILHKTFKRRELSTYLSIIYKGASFCCIVRHTLWLNNNIRMRDRILRQLQSELDSLI